MNVSFCTHFMLENNRRICLKYSIFNIQYSIFNIQYSIFNIQYSIFNIQYSILEDMEMYLRRIYIAFSPFSQSSEQIVMKVENTIFILEHWTGGKIFKG